MRRHMMLSDAHILLFSKGLIYTTHAEKLYYVKEMSEILSNCLQQKFIEERRYSPHLQYMWNINKCKQKPL